MANRRIIVIGAGTNGLACAGLLAKAGRDVLVLEAAPRPGGLAGAAPMGAEGFRSPGVLHDTSVVRPFVVRELELETHGLKFAPRPALFSPGDGDGGIWVRHDSVEGDGIDAADGDAYRAWRGFIDTVKPVVERLMDRPPLDIRGSTLQLLKTGWAVRRLGAETMVELLRVAPQCVADWMRDTFESEHLSATLSHGALEASFVGPWASHSAATLLIRECLSGDAVVGGGPALVGALVRAAEAYGAVIRSDTPVAKINVDADGVRGVTLADGEKLEASIVCATCDPRTALFDLVGRRTLTLDVAAAVQRYRMRGTTAKVHIALSGPLENRRGEPISWLRTGQTLDDVERAYDAAKYRALPEKPVLDVRVPDPGALAPADKYVVSVMAHAVPFDLRGGWTPDARDTIGDRVITLLNDACPTLRDRIVDVDVQTPADIAERHRLSGGHLHHGEHAPDQLLFMRPTISCKDYGTPIAGLFLGGSGTHPGGGLTCGPGALAAGAIHRAKRR